MSNDPGSWDELILSYENEKRHKIDIQKPARVTYKQVKAKERVFNPILGVYTDSKQEQSKQNESKEELLEHILNATKTRSTRGAGYNIINHETILDDLNSKKEVVAKQQIQDDNTSNQHFNLLTGELVDNTQLGAKPLTSTIVPKKKTHVYRQEAPRDYSILAPRDTLTEEEKREHREKVKKIKQKSFNTVLNRFEDKDKDKELEIAHKRETCNLQEKKEKYLPPSMKRNAEGRFFDIISNEPIREGFKSLERGRRITREVVEEVLVEEGDRIAARDMQRGINRISHKRFDDEYQKGYSIISNKPYYGMNSHPPPVNQNVRKPVDILLETVKNPTNAINREKSFKSTIHNSVDRSAFGRIKVTPNVVE
ncbi:hypothetical protein PCE1_000022 [Barthelona sp. PCE]